jgi:hypothetical protein
MCPDSAPQIRSSSPVPADLGLLRVRNRDHSQSVGTRPERSRREQACLQVGDGRPSDHVIRHLSQPDHLHTYEDDASRLDTPEHPAHDNAIRPEPDTARQRNGSASRPRSAERAESVPERLQAIHTLEMDGTAVPARSNNDVVDLDPVDKWLDCVPNLCHSTGDGPVSPQPRRRCWGATRPATHRKQQTTDSCSTGEIAMKSQLGPGRRCHRARRMPPESGLEGGL